MTTLGSKRRELIVDDNLDAAMSLTCLLRAKGYRVETAFNGHMGFDIAGRFMPDVYILDINMPGLNGYELATRIRASIAGRNNPVLATVTGYSDTHHRDQAAAAGFDLHITKGEDVADLLDQIEDTLTKRHKE